MINLEDIKRAAHIATNEQGQSIVKIPLDLWQEWLNQDEKPQHERIQAALEAWDVQAGDLSEEWWDEFQTFLKENRLNQALLYS